MIGALAALALLAPAAPAAAAAETSIPNARSDGIHEWQADGNRGLYIRSLDGDWYYARTLGPCGRLRTAVSIGIETRGGDSLDRNGAIHAEGWRCQLESLVRAEAPPKRR
ncbi:MAG: DUF6491 family protein [Allosphingosinicella sp.]|uniref:DUF6491 family protein n=1 Tax=Allosphingosinicella sp. TaxID=2823234 RepID=UPI003931F5AC